MTPRVRKPPALGSVVSVTWIDADTASGWREVSTIAVDESPEIRSVGFVLLWGEKVVVIASSVDPTNGTAASSTSIPWPAITGWKTITAS